MHVRVELHRHLSRISHGLAAGLLIACSGLLGAAPALAQMPMPGGGGGMPGAKSAAPDPLLESTSRWDANHDGILTCDEWRQYANRLFTIADKNNNGFLDATEFQHIGKIEPIFAGADFSYFDDNHDGKVSRAEFVDKPSPFFARYDLNHDCRVTSQELKGLGGAPQRGGPKGGGAPGIGGGRGAF
jgi:hypothetical protein